MIRSEKSAELTDADMLRDDALIAYAEERVAMGLSPPPMIYRVEIRRRIDWSRFPYWARPVDPELFDGCCHEG